ncbi:BTAD domain-containing putative transcriptional regulator [Microbacterium amylolyticum]|uniref:ATPase/DNA-binding SARP family transcriptional activator n=1 Tax=Microbacterium amylolyticum TaxID=936337 RepID=A0ABS4ZJ98_9MICO|nr:BTAD domain-containing putative transcriptional regulator [Microbacterium amylolyticum]MBP2437362.1 putative ATPase/DNA-binding SARP family transcriptional activator [Microbacterium amylolyticum]
MSTGISTVGVERRVHVRVLGQPEVDDDGHRITVRGERRQAVLLALALAGGDPVTRDHLIERVWGDDAPSTVSTSLRVIISQLRRELGAQLIETTDAGYRLAALPSHIDAIEFGRLVEEGRALVGAGSFRAARTALHTALSLWNGVPAVADVPLAADVDELTRMRSDATFLHAQADLHCADTPINIAVLENLVDDRPYDENAWALLMTGLFWAGRQADALEAFRAAQRTLRDDLGIDPGPALVDLETAILTQDPRLAPPASARVDVPGFTTPFVGRDRDVAHVAERLSRERLVTITGIGGAGKTRVAAEAARVSAADFPGGVAFVELGSLTDGLLLPRRIASALDSRSESIDGLGEDIGSRRVLIILDAAEHLAHETAHVISALLERCPALSALVTSRVPLNLRCETVYPLDMLDVPSTDTVDACAASDAAQLLLRRATTADPTVALGSHNATTVARICQLLDGHPLALELAAARCGVLSLDDVLDQLRSDAPWRATDRDRPTRQRSLSDALAWTIGALSPTARTLLIRLSVFRDPPTLDGIRHVCSGGRVTEETLVDAVDELLTSAMLRVVAGDPRRYRLPGPVHSIAQSLLDASGEEVDVRARGAEAVGHLLEGARSAVASPDQATLFARVDAHINDVRAALDDAQRNDRAALAVMCVQLRQYWTAKRLHDEARTRLDAAFAADLAPALLADLLETSAWFHLDAGDAPALVIRDATRCRDIREELGDSASVATALMLLGAAASHEGDHDSAAGVFSEALVIARREGDPVGILRASFNLALAQQKLGRLAAADRALVDALSAARRARLRTFEALVLERRSYIAAEDDAPELARSFAHAAQTIRTELGDQLELCRSFWSVALSEHAVNEHDGAVTNLISSIRIAQEHNFSDAWWVPGILELAATLLESDGALLSAARLLGAASALRDREGVGPGTQTVPGLEQLRASLKDVLGTEQFTSEHTAGATQTGPDALALAGEALGARAPA